MKYVIDVDAFIECLGCVDSIKVNGDLYVAIPLLKEFVQRFPKEKVESEYREVCLSGEAPYVSAE